MGLLDWAMPISQGISTGVNALLTNSANKQNLALQKQEWAREDSSYQRKVADLKAAGLNPALALGGGSPSSLAVRVGAPQVEAPDMTAPIRMNLMRQQAGIAASDFGVKAAEAEYLKKFWHYKEQHAETDAEIDTQMRDFRRQLAGIDVNRGELGVKGDQLSNLLKDLTYKLETQLGAPGSGPQIIRAILGGQGGMLDLIRTLK